MGSLTQKMLKYTQLQPYKEDGYAYQQTFLQTSPSPSSETRRSNCTGQPLDRYVLKQSLRSKIVKYSFTIAPVCYN